MASLNHAHTNHNSSRVAAAEQAETQKEQLLWKLLLVVALTYLVWTDNVSIILGPVSLGETSQPTEPPQGERVKAAMFGFTPHPKKSEKKLTEVEVALPPNALNNVTFAIDPAFARRYSLQTSEMEIRLTKCRDYVERFAPVAIAEMRQSGIPASIKLAQGLLESNAGESKLAMKTNNHFGIKCFSKRCKAGHCANFTDDTHKDFFVKYANAKGGYRAHSQFLRNSSRYKHLFELEPTDYRAWARGLAQAGYATDKQYGEKLIAIIQTLDLDRYDMP
ncbi:MAG: glucosaminidase domain-containing protein [Saprospiraceae bacterium]|nr:glucosaminidase domain-containing protein [Saprospiraceae bacterium]